MAVPDKIPLTSKQLDRSSPCHRSFQLFADEEENKDDAAGSWKPPFASRMKWDRERPPRRPG